jgi:hypothetical protein
MGGRSLDVLYDNACLKNGGVSCDGYCQLNQVAGEKVMKGEDMFNSICI